MEEANAVLPWLEDLLGRMVPLRDRLESQQVELMSLMQRRSGNGASSHDQEIVEIQKTMDDLAQELRGTFKTSPTEGDWSETSSGAWWTFPPFKMDKISSFAGFGVSPR